MSGDQKSVLEQLVEYANQSDDDSLPPLKPKDERQR